MKRYSITETVTIRKVVATMDEEGARSLAYQRLPDYEKAGWELVGSEGPDIKEL